MIGRDDYEAIRARVERRFQERYAFYTHVAVYTLVNIVMWVIYSFTSGMAWQISQSLKIDFLFQILAFPWPLVLMAVWGIGLVAHGLNYYIRYGGGAVRREMAMQREIEHELTLRDAYEKPKNDRRVRLTEDGELETIDDETGWLKHKNG